MGRDVGRRHVADRKPLWFNNLQSVPEKRGPLRSDRTRERVLLDYVVGHRPAADHVLLDNPVEHVGIAGPVPGALRVDHRDRPALADPQAVGLRAQHAAPLGEAELLEAALQEAPGGKAPLLVAALRDRLIATEEDVPAGDVDADRGGDPALARDTAQRGRGLPGRGNRRTGRLQFAVG